MNGKFSRFMDPDTDTAWIGFKAGFLVAFTRLSHALAAETAKREADTDLLFDAYKGLLVLFRVLAKAGLAAGADTTNALTNAIEAKHPGFPARTALRATPAKHGSKT